MRRRLDRLVVLGMVAGLALPAAGCSSDSGSDSESAKGAGSTVSIGVVGAFSGIPGLPNPTPKVMEAWEKTVNAAGGLDGHQVDVIVKDVGTQTGAGRAAVQELITKDEVVAIIDQDFSDATWLPYAEEKQVPVLYAFNGAGPFMSENVFPVSMSPVALAYSMAAAMKDAGGVGAVGYASEIAAGAQIVASIEGFADQLGVKLPVVAKMSSTQPDYTAFCQQMKDADVTANIVSFGADVATKITSQCAEQGAGGTPVLVGLGASPDWKTIPAYDGAAAVDATAPFFDESVPGVKAYRDALTEYAPDVPDSPADNGTPLIVWAAAQMVAAAAEKVDGDLTGANLQQALFSVSDETLDGLVAPITYTKGETSTVDCWFTWKVSGGEFVSTNDAKPTCAPEADLQEAEDALAKSMAG